MRALDLSWPLVGLLLLVTLAPLAGVGPQNPTVWNARAGEPPSVHDGEPVGGRGAGDDVSLEFEAREPGDDELMRNTSHRYTLNLTNEGTVQDTFQLDFESDAADWIGSLETDNLTLAAGASRTFYFEARTPHDAIGDNTFNLTATSTNNSDNYDSKELNLHVDMSYAVDMEPPKGGNETSGPRTSQVSYKVRIMNTGQNLDSYTLRTEEVPKDWKVKIVPASVSDIGQGEGRDIYYNVTIPRNAAQGETARIKLIATSLSHANIEAFRLTRTNASDGRLYGVTLAATPTNQTTTIAGGSPTYELLVTNTGNETETFILDHDTPAPYWSASISPGQLALGASESATVKLTITAPENASLGDRGYLNVTAASKNRSAYRDSVELLTTIREPHREVSVTVTPATLDAPVGGSVTYTLNITNLGLDPDDIDLEVAGESPPGWLFQLAEAKLYEVGVNRSRLVNLTVSVPGEALADDLGWGNVTVTSSNDATASDQISTRTKAVTAPAFNLLLLPPHLVTYPDHVVRMMVQVTNVGNIQDSYDITVLDLPAGWQSLVASPTLSDLDLGQSSNAVISITSSADAPTGFGRFNLSVTSHANRSLVKVRLVTYEVEPYAEFRFTSDHNSSQVEPGGNLSFTFTLTNAGPQTDTATLEVKQLEAGWSPRFFVGDTAVDNHTVTLAAGSQQVLTLEVPLGANDHAGNFTLILRAIPANNPELFTEMDLQLEVLPKRGYLLSRTEATTASPAANTSYTEQVRLTNLGNVPDTYTVVLPEMPPGWSAEMDPRDPFTLEGGDDQVITLTFTVAVEPMGGRVSLPVIFHSTTHLEPKSNFTWHFDLPQTYGLELLLEGYPTSSLAAGTHGQAFVLRVTNTGDGMDRFNLTLGGNQAAWFNRTQVEVTVAPGTYVDLPFDVTIPAGAAAQLYTVSGLIKSLGDDRASQSFELEFTTQGGTTTQDDDEGHTPDDDGGGFLPGLSLAGSLAALLLSFILVLRRRH